MYAKMRALLVGAVALLGTTFVSAATIGTLTYDAETGTIADSASQLTYLGWDKTKNFTYQEALDATSEAGQFSNYRIATSTEAFAFFEAVGGLGTLYNGTEPDEYEFPDNSFGDGIFGDNNTNTFDAVYFVSSEDDNSTGLNLEFGRFFYNSGSEHALPSLSYTSLYRNQTQLTTSGMSNDGLLLVSGDNVSPVPLPPAAWLFGTALLGFMARTRLVARSGVVATRDRSAH